MGFLKSLSTTVIPAAAAAAAAAATSLSIPSLSSSSPSSNSSKSSNTNSPLFKTLSFPSLSKRFSPPLTSLHMDSPTITTTSSAQKQQSSLPQLVTEFMVDMKCDGCVTAVKNKLLEIDGVKGVEADLTNQVVRVVGSSPVKTLADALEQTGRKARLIGQGNPQDFLISSAVAEFKGPDIFGVVRVAQVNMELARVEASFSGLSPGKHGWSINEFGDLTKGAASTGKVFDPSTQFSEKPLGDLGTLDAQETGEAFYSDVKEMLRVTDLIGRAIVLYETEDKSDPGITAAVIARSAGVGENYKKLCTCDGTTIWESSNTDFAVSKV